MAHFEEAIRNYQKAIQLKPDYAEAYNNLGNVLNESGFSKDAGRNFKVAIQLNPSVSEPYWNKHGLCSTISEAINLLQKTHIVRPTDQKVLITLAGLKAISGVKDHYDTLDRMELSTHPFKEVPLTGFKLDIQPKVYFSREDFFDAMALNQPRDRI